MKNNKDVDSLSHTTWRCQYHVVFAPKYRRMVIYGQIKKDIGQMLRKLCEQKDIEIIEAEACPEHIHSERRAQYAQRMRHSCHNVKQKALGLTPLLCGSF